MLAADQFIVDTNDPKLYPIQFSGQSVLVAGTFTISGPVFSLTARTDAPTCTLGIGSRLLKRAPPPRRWTWEVRGGGRS